MTLKFQNCITPPAIAEAESRIDPCAFGTVIDYYNNPETEIETVLVVDLSLKLEEIAAEGDFAPAIEELVEKNLIRWATPGRERNKFGHESYTFAEIGVAQKVYVIQAAPFYLVQLTGEVWR